MSKRAFTLVCALLASLTTLTTCKRQSLIVDTPSGPEAGRAGAVLIYTSTATDPGGDSVCVRFDWGDGDTSSWSAWIASGATASDSHSWSTADTFPVRAQAQNAAGKRSDWSRTLEVAISATWTITCGGAANDDGFAVVQSVDGGYIVAGQTFSFGSGGDVYLVKTDVSGNVVWTKTLGGSGYDAANAIARTADGGCVAAGTGTNTMGANSAYLIKTDSSGNQTWVRSYGFLGAEVAHSVQPTSDGGYIIAGQTGFFSNGESDVYLVKTDADGNRIWHKNLGGLHNDVGRAVQQTGDGGYIILGETDTTGSGRSLMYLARTDASGNQVWTKTFSGGSDNHGYSVQIASDGGYILAGQTTGTGNGDVYVVKTDAGGNEVWARTYGGDQADEARCIQRTGNGGFVVVGATSSGGVGMYDVYLLSLDANGDTLWTRTFGGAFGDAGYSVKPTNDGGWIIAGTTSSYGAGGNDVWIIKTDSDGDLSP